MPGSAASCLADPHRRGNEFCTFLLIEGGQSRQPVRIELAIRIGGYDQLARSHADPGLDSEFFMRPIRQAKTGNRKVCVIKAPENFPGSVCRMVIDDDHLV